MIFPKVIELSPPYSAEDVETQRHMTFRVRNTRPYQRCPLKKLI